MSPSTRSRGRHKLASLQNADLQKEISQWTGYPSRFVRTLSSNFFFASAGNSMRVEETEWIVFPDLRSVNILLECLFSFQVLVHVLSFLPVSDRLNSALTCKRWARALCVSQLLEDVSLTIESADQLKAAEAVLMRTHREYRILKLSNGKIT